MENQTDIFIERLVCGILENVDLATAIAAGVEIDTSYDAKRNVFTVKTKYPIKILREKGSVAVFQIKGEKMPQKDFFNNFNG